jgi:hypothetical protein
VLSPSADVGKMCPVLVQVWHRDTPGRGADVTGGKGPARSRKDALPADASELSARYTRAPCACMPH